MDELEASAKLVSLMVEADQSGECWCGKDKAHAGWLDCLERQAKRIANTEHHEEQDGT